MNEIIFLVKPDPTGGYTARALGYGIFTEGENEQELAAKVRDAVECHFDKPEEMPKIVRLHYVRDEVFAL